MAQAAASHLGLHRARRSAAARWGRSHSHSFYTALLSGNYYHSHEMWKRKQAMYAESSGEVCPAVDSTLQGLWARTGEEHGRLAASPLPLHLDSPHQSSTGTSTCRSMSSPSRAALYSGKVRPRSLAAALRMTWQGNTAGGSWMVGWMVGWRARRGWWVPACRPALQSSAVVVRARQNSPSPTHFLLVYLADDALQLAVAQGAACQLAQHNPHVLLADSAVACQMGRGRVLESWLPAGAARSSASPPSLCKNPSHATYPPTHPPIQPPFVPVATKKMHSLPPILKGYGTLPHPPSTSYTENMQRSLSSRLEAGRKGASRPCGIGHA